MPQPKQLHAKKLHPKIKQALRPGEFALWVSRPVVTNVEIALYLMAALGIFGFFYIPAIELAVLALGICIAFLPLGLILRYISLNTQYVITDERAFYKGPFDMKFAELALGLRYYVNKSVFSGVSILFEPKALLAFSSVPRKDLPAIQALLKHRNVDHAFKHSG